MVLTTPIVLTYSHGIESVLLNHTHMRGPSVARMRDFYTHIFPQKYLVSTFMYKYGCDEAKKQPYSFNTAYIWQK